MKAIVKALKKNYLVEFKNDADFLTFVTNFNDKIQDVEVITEDKLPELEKPVDVAKPSLSDGWKTLEKSAFVDKEKGVDKKGPQLGGKYAEFKYEPDKNLENSTDDKVSEPKNDSPALKGEEPKVADVEATAKEAEVKDTPKAEEPKSEEHDSKTPEEHKEWHEEHPEHEHSEEKKEAPAEEKSEAEDKEDDEKKEKVDESVDAEIAEVMEAAGVESETTEENEKTEKLNEDWMAEWKARQADTVKDLIAKLQKCDPNAKIICSDKPGRGAMQCVVYTGFANKWSQLSETQDEEHNIPAVELTADL